LSEKKKIGIVGATGYTGEELLRVLARHSGVQVAFVTSEKEQGKPVSTVFPYLPYYHDLHFINAQQVLTYKVDLVFLCLPAGQSAPLAVDFLKNGIRVIDLGADFRFYDGKSYEQWYRQPHTHPELLKEAVYGLPEWNRESIRPARVVGNPGCYPTSVLLATIPLAKAGVLADAPVLIDSKSGVSGAGKALSKTTHYVEVNESLKAYKAGRVHRHVGEMEQELSRYAGSQTKVIFTPHLTPMSRGIFSTIYLQLERDASREELLSILANAYDNEPFVHVLEDEIPSTKMAAHSNNCFISLDMVEGTNHAIVFSAIDNLGKGASWQAIQNMNIMLNFREEMGLL